MDWFHPPRSAVPALLLIALPFLVGNACDSGAPPTGPPRGVLELNPPTTVVAPGEVLIVPYLFSDGSDTPLPTRPQWSSSDPAVALVDAHGAVTALAEGTTVIRARHEAARDSVLLTVRPIRYRQVVAGEGEICGLTPDGALYCWGNVGPGHVPERTFPLRIASELVLDRIDLEEQILCGIDVGGDLYCARANPERTLPKRQGGPYVAVSSAGPEICSVSSQGPTTCGSWTHPFGSPVAVPPLAAIDNGWGGFTHKCGVTRDGEAWCWGRNEFGELGNGNRVDSFLPTRVSTSLRFRQVEAGDDFTCGVTFDEEMWCWGLILYGAADDAVSEAPYRIPLPAPVTSIESGGREGMDGGLVCAIAGGEVWCIDRRFRRPPVPIGGFPPLVDLSVGLGNVCGTTQDHVGWCYVVRSPGLPTRVPDRSAPIP